MPQIFSLLLPYFIHATIFPLFIAFTLFCEYFSCNARFLRFHGFCALHYQFCGSMLCTSQYLHRVVNGVPGFDAVIYASFLLVVSCKYNNGTFFFAQERGNNVSPRRLILIGLAYFMRYFNCVVFSALHRVYYMKSYSIV